MALQEGALSSALKAIFDAMDGAAGGSPKNNQWYADQMAKAISDQIKTAGVPAGTVITTVSGGSGAPAVGVPNPAEIKVV
jgi:hypothetical protein